MGKTTLARGIGDERGALYLDLESREDRDKLASPRLYLERLADRLVILAEIDLLLERPDGRLWAIEIKRALTAKPRRGFYVACEDLKPARAFVVYAGEERYPVAEGVEAIGVREMAALVAGA